jgi:saccharopine dehydrogenase (NAD+, L-lysine-forming)
MKVVVLGGCGAVGSISVKALAAQDLFSEVRIGDFNIEKAKTLASQLGPKVTAVKVNAEDPKSIKDAIKGFDVVLNCVGPFYKTGAIVQKAVIESKINFVDISDDVDVTSTQLDMDKDAKAAGVTCLIGMGSSPGATNLLAKLAAETLLDETDSIDIFHTHGGEPIEGPGVIGHRFHCMTIDVPMFLDGKLKYVKYFEPDGIALRQEFEFPLIGKTLLYPYPHPEQVTIPKYIKTKQVTNKGSVLPAEYYNMTRDLCHLGFSSREPVNVNGQDVIPYDFAVAYIIRERDRILKELKFGSQRGCCSVVAKGKKAGKYQEYRFHMASRSQALGEGTGIPAAMGVILMAQGKVKGPGVFPPEGCVNPNDFISLISKVMSLDKKKDDDSFSGVIVESVDEAGNITKLDI